MSAGLVPVIDLSLPEAEVLPQIDAACRDTGFFQISGHGIDANLCRSALQVGMSFFAMPEEDKLALERSFESPWGYYDRELTKNRRDLKEIFDFAPNEEAPWPSALPEFQTLLASYSQAVHQLALHVLELCVGAYGGSGLQTQFGHDHSSFCRFNHYPVGIGEGLGISRHTDAGGLTILLQDQQPGLEMYCHGQWQLLQPVADTFTVNIGDMLQLWSNDSYTAPLHRVRASDTSSRYSIAYFLNPSYDAVIEPQGKEPVYRPLSWAEFRSLRAQGDYGDYGEEVQLSHYKI